MKKLISLLCLLLTAAMLLTAGALADEYDNLDFRYALRVENFTEDGLALFQARNGLYGYVNTDGDVVIAPQYVDAGSFGSGLAPVSMGGLWGYIDTTGALVVDYQWAFAAAFSEGLARVRDGALDLLGYIDTTGTLVIPCQYYSAYDFVDGVANVSGGSIDRAGNPVERSSAEKPFTFEKEPEGKYPTYHVYCNGAFALTVSGANKYFELEYSSIQPVQGAENLWVISGQYLYNSATNQVLMRDMSSISTVCSEGLIHVRRDGETYFVDVNGRMVIAPVNAAYDFSCGYALVELQATEYDQAGYPLNVYTYIDTAGEESYYVYDRFERAFPLVNGYAIVKNDGEWQVISEYYLRHGGAGG